MTPRNWLGIVTTNETVFSLTEHPTRLAVVGGGSIGCELAQTFQRLGSHVVLLYRNAHILDREDADAAQLVQQAFMQEGIQLVLNSVIVRVEKTTCPMTIAGLPEHTTLEQALPHHLINEVLHPMRGELPI
jgi:pyruvate/2-oxoglutarate dehydrogenase complex dihydrolipoamide dehydrogenase (E3) component